MNKSVQISVYFMLLALLIQVFPQYAAAELNEPSIPNKDREVILFATQPESEIELYQDLTAKQVMANIPDETVVELMEEKGEFSLIKYTSEVDDEDSTGAETAFQGYVRSTHVIELFNVEEFKKNRQDEVLIEKEVITESVGEDESEELLENEEGNETQILPDTKETISDSELELDETELTNQVEIEENADEDLSEEIAQSEVEEMDEQSSRQNDELEVNKEEETTISKPTLFRSFSIASTSVKQLRGVAIENSTNVYSQTSKSSSVLKAYKRGHILIYRAHSPEWYEATVYINGKAQTGYIYANDVDAIIDQHQLKGFAQKQPVNVYTTPTRQSGVLKSYQQGHALSYKSFSSQWHEATVYVNGKAEKGYIHSSDVGEKAPLVQTPLKGIALVHSTTVYNTPSKNSGKLKAYNKGQILQYRSYNSEWHEATVYLNGKAHTGYIHVNDVETAKNSPSTLQGLALKSITHIYSSASTNSKVLKSYNHGSLLKYREFTSNWYEATVYINGKAHTGYISAGDLEEIIKKQQTIKGLALKNPTKVYAVPSSGSKVLKSYKMGQNMTYRTFTTDWYEATVYVNGKAITGYIHKDDVGTNIGKVVIIDPGHGGSDSGALGIGLVEKTLNLDISIRAKKLLESAGFTVIMTRTTDVFISLQERARIANTSNADIFISIHGNSFNANAKGVETFWYGKYEKAKSIQLATALQKNVVNITQSDDRSVKEGNFHVIRETKIPSALLEVGFVDNPIDAAKLRQNSYKQLLAEGILSGTLEYFK
ncbi:N-acetylmuramoyl-L-alanine amidase [Lederbergia lenta]|uniref:N-acetylmuramoyl-L-alanine amidase n=1 Tax=Lederbergia lenta TaxID=1467 RepID=UPI00203E4CD2|nr:N-acetylmuramoyl-L-alanine amidase [Lederbergia lenta]MCM3112003.1 N-acetylmuramoyl-L-alanine amidase [Lederbergia lenta]